LDKSQPGWGPLIRVLVWTARWPSDSVRRCFVHAHSFAPRGRRRLTAATLPPPPHLRHLVCKAKCHFPPRADSRRSALLSCSCFARRGTTAQAPRPLHQPLREAPCRDVIRCPLLPAPSHGHLTHVPVRSSRRLLKSCMSAVKPSVPADAAVNHRTAPSPLFPADRIPPPWGTSLW
jgi:hypothetical protein